MLLDYTEYFMNRWGAWDMKKGLGRSRLMSSQRPQSAEACSRISNTNKLRDILKRLSPEEMSNHIFHSENKLTKPSSSIQMEVNGWGCQVEMSNSHFQRWSVLSASPSRSAKPQGQTGTGLNPVAESVNRTTGCETCLTLPWRRKALSLLPVTTGLLYGA